MFEAIVEGMGQLLAAFYTVIPNYGVGIIMLTVLVRLAMIPLAFKQAHIMEKNRPNVEKMRKVAPELKKLKQKYRGDPKRLREEQMKLYQSHEVNPMGQLSGCLPAVVQMPVFLAMYQVLQGCNKLFGSGRTCELGYYIPEGTALKRVIVSGRDTFLGLNLNVQPAQALEAVGFLGALPYYLMVGLMGYSMWYMMRQTMNAQPVMNDQMGQTQKIMQKVMPLMVVFFSLSFPAGLVVYWTASNVWGIGQQAFLTSRYGPSSKRTSEEGGVEESSGSLASRLKTLLPVGSERTDHRSAAAEEVKTSKAEKDGVSPGSPAPERKTRSTGGKPVGQHRSAGGGGRVKSSAGRAAGSARAGSGAPRKPAARKAPTGGPGGAKGGGGGGTGSGGSGAGRPKGSGSRKKGGRGHR